MFDFNVNRFLIHWLNVILKSNHGSVHWTIYFFFLFIISIKKNKWLNLCFSNTSPLAGKGILCQWVKESNFVTMFYLSWKNPATHGSRVKGVITNLNGSGRRILVTIYHFIGSFCRFWLKNKIIDWTFLFTYDKMSKCVSHFKLGLIIVIFHSINLFKTSS